MKAGLYLVALPIGNLGDMSFRAVETLRGADQIWAEDTRNLRKILNYFEIDQSPRNLVACHDHNEREMAGRMVSSVQDGQRIAYVSDAGMPLISDPGFRLVQAAQEAEIYHTVLPGPSAVPTALALSGMPTDQFAFLGFVPNKDGKRKTFFEGVSALGMTTIAFESPRRVAASLAIATQVLGEETKVAIVREISKTYEEVIKGNLSEVLSILTEREIKGEVVLVFEAVQVLKMGDEKLQEELARVMQTERLKDAVKIVAEQFNQPRNRVYELALILRNQE